MQKKKVVIVDDDEFFLKGLSDVLDKAGFHTLVAKSWVDLAEITADVIPDLILLDLVMPSLSGEKICNVLKRQRKTRDIPVLLYSGQEREKLESLARECGAQGIVEKSKDFEEIVFAIIHFLKGWKQQQEPEDR